MDIKHARWMPSGIESQGEGQEETVGGIKEAGEEVSDDKESWMHDLCIDNPMDKTTATATVSALIDAATCIKCDNKE